MLTCRHKCLGPKDQSFSQQHAARLTPTRTWRHGGCISATRCIDAVQSRHPILPCKGLNAGLQTNTSHQPAYCRQASLPYHCGAGRILTRIMAAVPRQIWSSWNAHSPSICSMWVLCNIHLAFVAEDLWDGSSLNLLLCCCAICWDMTECA